MMIGSILLAFGIAYWAHMKFVRSPWGVSFNDDEDNQ
jgi:hypothetical protein